MNTRKDQRKSCGKKIRFESFAEANLQKQEGRRKGNLQPGMMTSYKCKFCGYYHFGHTPLHRRKR